MILRNTFLALYICSHIGCCFAFVEPISAVIVGAGIAAMASFLYYKVQCPEGNCCRISEIPANFEALEELLEEKVFGQPLVQNSIVSQLKTHWGIRKMYHKQYKALALSFHGGPGVGKNYVSKFIQEALYSAGGKSPHVHTFTAKLNFPEGNKVEIYKKNLASWITGNVSNCPKQLFIFDEVHDMPPGILDAINPFLDYHGVINGVSYNDCIFIFLSNTGSNLINNHVYELLKKGVDRNNIRLDHFQSIIAQGAFNEKGGFYHSKILKSNLIDSYIPFLPLMEPHVRACIKEEFNKRGVLFPPESEIQEVLEFIGLAPDEDRVFSKTGCKRIRQKVAIIADYY